jgi:DNA repair exonuclease SbcCD ATPase subunit
MPQRKPQNKLPEIGECLEKLQTLEPNVTEEDFQVIGEIKEYLDVIKGKWKTLNTNYKTLFQEKTNYEGDAEKMIQSISKLNEEKAKYLQELKVLEGKLSVSDALVKKVETENKSLIESIKLLETTFETEKIDFKNGKDLLVQEKSELENEIKTLKDLLETKDQLIEKVREEKDSLYSILDSKYNILVSENVELLNKINVLSDIELRNKKLLEEKLDQLKTEKDHRIRVLEARISSMEYEKTQDLEKKEDQIQILTSQKKNAEKLLVELTIKLEKKSKCSIM